jgi:hypothetical protein
MTSIPFGQITSQTHNLTQKLFESHGTVPRTITLLSAMQKRPFGRYVCAGCLELEPWVFKPTLADLLFPKFQSDSVSSATKSDKSDTCLSSQKCDRQVSLFSTFAVPRKSFSAFSTISYYFWINRYDNIVFVLFIKRNHYFYIRFNANFFNFGV